MAQQLLDLWQQAVKDLEQPVDLGVTFILSHEQYPTPSRLNGVLFP